MKKIIDKRKIIEKHGSIISPASRARLYLPEWEATSLESGKFFPRLGSGLRDATAEDDVQNNPPPADWKIASAGQDFASMLDVAGRENWRKDYVVSGSEITFRWRYRVKHCSRRWNYFMTRVDWNPEEPLARAQFDKIPFYSVELRYQPYWLYIKELTPPNPTEHTCKLPDRVGYHVILAVCELADLGSAYYQVIDMDFSI